MNVLVLGATGHIGNAFVREFLHQGQHVTAISRRKEPPANLSKLPMRYLSGDIDTPGQLDAWVKGHDVVVDAAAPYPIPLFNVASTTGKNPLSYATQRTQALLDTVCKYKTQLIYVSSFTTLLQHRQGLENWPAWIRQLHPYFAVKELIESQVRAAAHSGVPVIIGNPTLCLGPWDMKDRDLCFVPRVLSGELPIAVQQIVNVIDVRDVARGLVAALQEKRYGEPICLSGQNIAADALQSWICELGGTPPPRFSLPASLSVLPAYAMEALQILTKQPVSVPALSMLLLCQHEWRAPSAAQQELGLVPRPLSETLRDTIQWYRELGYC